MSRYLTIVSLYWLVGVIAWTNGWLSGIWLERRRCEQHSWPPPRFVDLREPAPAYDWAVDGGGECTDCGGTGWIGFPDPFLGGAHLDAACPTCMSVLPGNGNSPA